MQLTPQLKQLIAQIERGNCVLFVGSGVSTEAGLPSAWDLTQELAQMIDYPLENEPLSTIAQYVEDTPGFGRAALISFLEERLIDSKIGESHRLIPRFPWAAVYTTNYDTLIEDGYEATGQQSHPVLQSTDLSALKDKKTTPIIKLHGCITVPRSRELPLIVTDKDYLDFGANRQALINDLKHHMYQRSILFIGHSLKDDNFRRIYNDIRQELREYQLYSYAVIPRFSEQQARFWENNRIILLPYAARVFLRHLSYFL